jgi:hypothetical protein
MAIITSGGSSEREQKELTVMPCGVPSEARVVNTATPVAKAPQALRNSSLNDGALDNWLTPILSWGFSRVKRGQGFQPRALGGDAAIKEGCID